MNYLIGAVVGLLWGALAAFVNSRITKSAIKKGTNSAIMTMNFAHMFIDLVALAVVFFLRRLLPFSFEATLIATAAAMSIITIIFNYSMSFDDKK